MLTSALVVMGNRDVVNSDTNLHRPPFEIRVAHFQGPFGREREHTDSEGGLSHGQDTSAFENVAHCGTGLDLDSAMLSAVLGSENLLCQSKSGSGVSHAAPIDSSSAPVGSSGLLLVRHFGCRYRQIPAFLEALETSQPVCLTRPFNSSAKLVPHLEVYSGRSSSRKPSGDSQGCMQRRDKTLTFSRRMVCSLP